MKKTQSFKCHYFLLTLLSQVEMEEALNTNIFEFPLPKDTLCPVVLEK